MQLLLYSFLFLMLLSNFLIIYGIDNKIVFGLVFICISGLCLTLLLFSKNKIKFSKLSLLIIALFMVGFLMVPVSAITNNIIYFNYVAGDALLIFYIIIILLFFANFKGFISLKSLKNFLIYLSIIDLFHWFIRVFYLESFVDYGFTTMPPTPFAYCLSFGFFSKKKLHQILSFIFAITSIMVNIISTGKINAISYLLLLLFTFFIYMDKRKKIEFLITFSLTLTILFAVNIPLIKNLQTSRAYIMIENISKPIKHSLSITERQNEIGTSYKTMLDISSITMLVGLGHGAVWPLKNYPEDIRSLYRNLTKEGFIHNIHIGPILLLFRYGVFGILTFFTIFYLIGRSIIYIRKNFHSLQNDQQKTLNLILLFSTNVLVILLFRWLVMNTLINPLFGFALGFNIFVFKQLNRYSHIYKLSLV